MDKGILKSCVTLARSLKQACEEAGCSEDCSAKLSLACDALEKQCEDTGDCADGTCCAEEKEEGESSTQ